MMSYKIIKHNFIVGGQLKTDVSRRHVTLGLSVDTDLLHIIRLWDDNYYSLLFKYT